MAGRILALGSVNADAQAQVARWPEPGESLMAERFELLPGGKGANVCRLARRLGADATLLARVGEDALAEVALSPLREAGVDLSRVHRVPDRPTGTALIAVRADAEKAIVYAPNANEGWTESGAEEVEDAIRRAEPGSVLVVDLEVSPFVVDRAIEAARVHGVQVVLDPSPSDRVTRYQLGNVAWVTPNRGEAGRLTGMRVRTVDDAFRAGERILAQGVRYAAVKVGERGCVLVGPGVREHVQPPAGHAVDRTGGGDAFAGALAVALLEGRDPVEACWWAATAARLVVSAWGSQTGQPDRQRLLEAVEQGRRVA